MGDLNALSVLGVRARGSLGLLTHLWFLTQNSNVEELSKKQQQKNSSFSPLACMPRTGQNCGGLRVRFLNFMHFLIAYQATT